MTEMTLPPANSVFDLSSTFGDTTKVNKGVWSIVAGNDMSYVEMRIASTETKAYEKAITDYMLEHRKKNANRTGGSDIPPDFKKKQAEFAALYLVTGWRTFVPQTDASGKVVMEAFNPEDGSVIEDVAAATAAGIEVDYRPNGQLVDQVAIGGEWQPFSISMCKKLLLESSSIRDAVLAFASDVENFTKGVEAQISSKS